MNDKKTISLFFHQRFHQLLFLLSSRLSAQTKALDYYQGIDEAGETIDLTLMYRMLHTEVVVPEKSIVKRREFLFFLLSPRLQHNLLVFAQSIEECMIRSFITFLQAHKHLLDGWCCVLMETLYDKLHDDDANSEKGFLSQKSVSSKLLKPDSVNTDNLHTSHATKTLQNPFANKHSDLQYVSNTKLNLALKWEKDLEVDAADFVVKHKDLFEKIETNLEQLSCVTNDVVDLVEVTPRHMLCYVVKEMKLPDLSDASKIAMFNTMLQKDMLPFVAMQSLFVSVITNVVVDSTAPTSRELTDFISVIIDKHPRLACSSFFIPILKKLDYSDLQCDMIGNLISSENFSESITNEILNYLLGDCSELSLSENFIITLEVLFRKKSDLISCNHISLLISFLQRKSHLYASSIAFVKLIIVLIKTYPVITKENDDTLKAILHSNKTFLKKSALKLLM